MTDYSMEEKTYRYFSGEPLYPFGYGLSYSKFYYHHALSKPTIQAGERLGIRIELSNAGPLDGDEVSTMTYFSNYRWVIPHVIFNTISLLSAV